MADSTLSCRRHQRPEEERGGHRTSDYLPHNNFSFVLLVSLVFFLHIQRAGMIAINFPDVMNAINVQDVVNAINVQDVMNVMDLPFFSPGPSINTHVVICAVTK